MSARILALLLCCSLAACKGAGSDDEGETGIPPGCEALFDQGEFACNVGDDACAAVEASPSRLVSWYVQFDEDLGGVGEPTDKVSDFAHKAECAQAYVDLHGLEITTGPIVNVWFQIESADFATMEALCRTSMVGDCSPYAHDEECKAHDEAACAADALCWAHFGTPLDQAQTCREPSAFARCFTQDTGCTDSPEIRQNQDGICWSFASGCFNSLDTEWQGAGSCPDLEGFEALPACP